MWKCPSCKQKVKVLSPIDNNIILECGCASYVVTKTQYTNAFAGLFKRIKKTTGWQRSKTKTNIKLLVEVLR